MRKVTISDVAQKAEVSRSTVSQYLNGRFDYMGKETRERIQHVIEELGYQPNFVARSLKQKTTKTIGVIVANILHAFSTELSRAIEDVCNESDFSTIICNADDDPDKEKRYIDMLRAKQVDGLIIIPTDGNKVLYNQMLQEQYPVVFVDRTVSDLPISSVLLNNRISSKLAVDHFIDKGHSRIGIITTSIIRNITPRVERIQGYKEALEKNGISVREDYINSDDLDYIQDDVHEMLMLEEPPTAILAGNDLALFEILKYVKENKLSIPDDLAVIGIDDVSFASIYSPTITTIAQPTFQMGKKATELLLNKIHNQNIKDEGPDYRFEPNLIIRESV